MKTQAIEWGYRLSLREKAQCYYLYQYIFEENEMLKKVSQFYVDGSGKYNLYFENGSVLQFANFSAFSYHKSFVLYFIKNMDMKQKVELIQGVNPIYSKI